MGALSPRTPAPAGEANSTIKMAGVSLVQYSRYRFGSRAISISLPFSLTNRRQLLRQHLHRWQRLLRGSNFQGIAGEAKVLQVQRPSGWQLVPEPARLDGKPGSEADAADPQGPGKVAGFNSNLILVTTYFFQYTLTQSWPNATIW